MDMSRHVKVTNRCTFAACLNLAFNDKKEKEETEAAHALSDTVPPIFQETQSVANSAKRQTAIQLLAKSSIRKSHQIEETG